MEIKSWIEERTPKITFTIASQTLPSNPLKFMKSGFKTPGQAPEV